MLNLFDWITSLRTKPLLYLVLGLIAISLCIDLIGVDGDHWFLGSTASTAYFLVPGVILHLNLPKTLRNNWLAIPMSILWWSIWSVVRSAMIGDGDFRPTVISMINLLLLYRLITTEQTILLGTVYQVLLAKFPGIEVKPKLAITIQLTIAVLKFAFVVAVLTAGSLGIYSQFKYLQR